MKSMKQNTNKFLALLGAVAATLSIAQAEIFTYTDGNLILGFQATSGTGSSQNVFFNLGSATGFRDNGAQGVLGNIGTTLSSVYGADWYTREDLYFGVVANLNQQPNSGIGFRAPVNGDPSRTFYISSPAATPGTGLLAAANTYSPSILGIGGNALDGLEEVLKPSADGTGWILADPDPLKQGLQKLANGSGTLDQTLSQHAAAWNNSWTVRNPTPGGAAFDIFTGGIQQNFGKVGSATYVDVQRVLAYSAGAVPAGVVGGGTYETTISISSGGVITSLSSSPTSAYDTWIGTYNPPLTNASDRLTTADPDGDGANNLEEFGFGGNPTSGSDQGTFLTQTLDANSDTQKDITLTIEVRTGATFSPSGNDLTSGLIDELNYRVEGSTDLMTWDSQVSEVTPHLGSGLPTTGYQFKTFRLNSGNGLAGKGFLRASVVK